MKSEYEHLRLEVESGIARVMLNRPERRNALSLALMRELTEALRACGAEREVRAVVLASSGPVFSSGHDLNELRGRGLDDYRRIFDACVELMEAVQRIPPPVIAEVDGLATAAGCQLVATCDLAVASPAARFATPGVRIGLFCSTPMVALTRAIGRKRALEMLLTGEPIDAATAADWGLVNRVVPADRLRDETRRLAALIAAHSHSTLALGKEAFYAQIELDQQRAYAYTKEVMSRNAAAADAQEGITAFLEKRAPCWRD
jgi:enoyl-CoA hydratase/carnithine racemase